MPRPRTDRGGQRRGRGHRAPGTGHRLVLIGLLALGPCYAVATGQWRRTAATGTLALGLGVLLGIPDGVFGTFVQYVFLAAIVVVACFATACAAVIQQRRTAG